MAPASKKAKSSPDLVAVQQVLEVDRLIHEPARLAIMAVLAACESADFRYIRHATNLTQGNLSTHLTKLEEAGYLSIEKRFVEKKPNTLCHLTEAGRAAFRRYRASVGKLVR